MNTDLLQRATFVLDKPTAERLSAIAARLGVSRSELVRDVLLEPIELMHRWVTALPDKPTQDQVRELMGQVDFAELVEDQLSFIVEPDSLDMM